ncbi:tumor necrosis factor ligand superfamily member 6 isoform X2 [Tachysurus vachellii]|uniref:tumor necrosis factor ligand superfamily member 6 isoform X2 n=1 Tax=Tachysurus vachellii TaxID=175792 RepID=UPI00296B389B|nr:tumor necrosis factor ligand superfamily member 6 isoform X2 [Tachysurus vachellii]
MRMRMMMMMMWMRRRRRRMMMMRRMMIMRRRRMIIMNSEDISHHSKQTGENKSRADAGSKVIPPTLRKTKKEGDTKSAAFLHLMHPPTSAQGVIQWSDIGFPAFTHSFNYSNGSLIIHKEGFYYLFSKVSFTNNCNTFKHEVKLNSSRYSNKPISLMVDNRHGSVNQIKTHEKDHFSSYLGGVFSLYKKEAVFVSFDKSCLSAGSGENFFGGFMI